MNEKNDSNSLELEKSKRRQSEIKKLKKIFKNIDENKKKIAEKLIDSAAFLTIELENLEKEISVEGVVEKYQNGENQSGVKKSSKVDVYNNFIKNYTAIVKQLCDLLPIGEQPDGGLLGNEVLKFATTKPVRK